MFKKPKHMLEVQSFEDDLKAQKILEEMVENAKPEGTLYYRKDSDINLKFDKVQYHKELCEKIQDLYERKNHDYGDSVNDTFQKFGIDAFLVRMYDKINRVYSLTRTQAEAKVQDEKIEDTLLDLANYAIIALTELANERNKVETITDKDEIRKMFEGSKSTSHACDAFREGPAVGKVDFSNCDQKCKDRLEALRKELEG